MSGKMHKRASRPWQTYK